MDSVTKAKNHLKTIFKHKFYVAKYCFKCGLYYQGIVHDLSKFSPTEFIESVKYYQGTSSPIDACKKAKGYSDAWFHHRGRNKHHWEYWVDDFQDGVVPKKMPFKYVLEMVCDFLGAGQAYMKDKFTIQSEYDWWQNRRKVVVMHQNTLALVDTIFELMVSHGIDYVLANKRVMNKLKSDYESAWRY